MRRGAFIVNISNENGLFTVVSVCAVYWIRMKTLTTLANSPRAPLVGISPKTPVFALSFTPQDLSASPEVFGAVAERMLLAGFERMQPKVFVTSSYDTGPHPICCDSWDQF